MSEPKSKLKLIAVNFENYWHLKNLGKFHKAYLQYCKKYALPPEKHDYFCKILKNDFEVSEMRVEIKKTGKREMWWSGITLTEEYAKGTCQERLWPPWTP